MLTGIDVLAVAYPPDHYLRTKMVAPMSNN